MVPVFIEDIQQRPLERWQDYKVRFQARAQRENVAELKKTLQELGYTERLAKAKKADLIAALLTLMEKTFFKDFEPADVPGKSASKSEVSASSKFASKKRRHREREDAEASN